MTTTTAENSYTEAVNKGDYDLYVGNLSGKYDNVRIYWEDQLTRLFIRPFLSELVTHKEKLGEKIRIIDLGSGTGQGYELLTKIDKRYLDLGLHHQRVLPENEVELYLGLDLFEAMVAKGNEIYEDKPQVQFMQGDLREGLAAVKKEEQPFDLYFSAYGSLSHLDTNYLKRLLTDICDHSRNGSLVALDLLGRYSIEWPNHWTIENEADKFCDYSMSYLYPGYGWEQEQDIEHFPLRFWTGAEVEALVDELRARTGVGITILKKFDRSAMVGRHVDTRQYNPRLRPIRRTVNSLHEDYLRTDLDELLLSKTMFPPPPHSQMAAFLDELITGWNILVQYCQKRLKKNSSLVELKGWSDFSAPLQFALMTIDRVINDTEWMWSGDPRANIIEPQLGYALRNLESDLQRGLGCGHGLLVMLKIEK